MTGWNDVVMDVINRWVRGGGGGGGGEMGWCVGVIYSSKGCIKANATCTSLCPTDLGVTWLRYQFSWTF